MKHSNLGFEILQHWTITIIIDASSNRYVEFFARQFGGPFTAWHNISIQCNVKIYPRSVAFDHMIEIIALEQPQELEPAVDLKARC